MPNGSPYRNHDVPFYLCTRFLAESATLVQSVALGWQIYAITGSAFALGLVGLVQFVPIFLLTLPAGEICDRFDPRRILGMGIAVEAACTAAFLFLTLNGVRSAWPFFAVLLVVGCARAFQEPAQQALLPFLVPEERLPKAIAWSSSVFEVAVIGGPALGGLLYAFQPAAPYAACCVASVAAALGTIVLGGRRRESDGTPLGGRVERVMEGLRFIRSRPVVLGAISLDLFAVLFGGATALLPIFARDILVVGPIGLGLLRSAPAVGSIVVALILGFRSIRRNTGVTLLIAVAIFGAATVAFGLSRNFELSLLLLAVIGGSDQVSVYIRNNLIQLATPDAMRGRVSAVHMLFVGTSNDLGSFESGAAAALLGTIPAVVLGGTGTLLVVAIWAKLFPALRKVDRLSDASG